MAKLEFQLKPSTSPCSQPSHRATLLSFPFSYTLVSFPSVQNCTLLCVDVVLLCFYIPVINLSQNMPKELISLDIIKLMRQSINSAFSWMHFSGAFCPLLQSRCLPVLLYRCQPGVLGHHLLKGLSNSFCVTFLLSGSCILPGLHTPMVS